MDFYERRWLYRLPERWEIVFSRHYEDRWRERSGKNWFKTKDLHGKIRYLIGSWKVKIGKIVGGEQSYYVIDNKKRKHSFVIVEDKLLMTTVFIPDWYIEALEMQRFTNRLFLNLILTLK